MDNTEKNKEYQGEMNDKNNKQYDPLCSGSPGSAYFGQLNHLNRNDFSSSDSKKNHTKSYFCDLDGLII